MNDAVASEAPRLRPEDLRLELERIHRVRHRSYTTAIAASGPETSVRIRTESGERMLRGVRVRCELELRRALATRGDDDLVLLVDYVADPLPPDIVGRIASGKVHRLDPGRRIAMLFRAHAASADLLSRRALTRSLLDDPPSIAEASAGPTIDLRTAFRAWLWHHAGIERSGELVEAGLLAHVATHEPTASVLALQPGSALEREVDELLQTFVGKLAPTLWRAWRQKQGRGAAALTFVLQAAHDKLGDAGLRNAVRVALRGVSPALAAGESLPMDSLSRWGNLADNLVLRLHDKSQLTSLLQLADEMVPEADLSRSLASSRYLPSAFRFGESDLAAALRECAEAPSVADFDRAKDCLAQLERHRCAERGPEQARIARSRMALRLVAYELARPDLEGIARSHGSLGEVYALAQHQSTIGGFVDHARSRAVGEVHTPLDQAIDAVVQRIHRLRDDDDLRFARAYAEWRAHGVLSSPEVRPIERLVSDVVVGFLADKPHRKLLVLVLDGMSWANAVELLLDLEDSHEHGLLRVPPALALPVLAAIPTITSVSRSALFAGKLVASGTEPRTGDDPSRFAEHAALARIGLDGSPLHLQGTLQGADGSLSRATSELVASDKRLVAVVVNALDDQLEHSTQIHAEATVRAIKPLRALLDAATKAGRAVLLASDHGHVPGHRLEPLSKGGDGPRHRFLTADEAALDEEVVVSSEVGYAPRGRKRVAMLARGCDGYKNKAKVGAHGGLSLAEVVAPAVLIGSDRLHEIVRQVTGVEDPELQVKPLLQPAMWRLELPASVRSPQHSTQPGVTTPSVPPAKPKAEPRAQPTLPLFGEEQLASSPGGAAPSTPPLPAAPARATPSPTVGTPSHDLVVDPANPMLRRLLTSKAFGKLDPAKRRELEERIAPRVAVLYDADHGRMSAARFAQAARILKHRVAGAVSELGEWVNFDQFVIVEFDPREQVVKLDKAKLDTYLEATK